MIVSLPAWRRPAATMQACYKHSSISRVESGGACRIACSAPCWHGHLRPPRFERYTTGHHGCGFRAFGSEGTGVRPFRHLLFLRFANCWQTITPSVLALAQRTEGANGAPVVPPLFAGISRYRPQRVRTNSKCPQGCTVYPSAKQKSPSSLKDEEHPGPSWYHLCSPAPLGDRPFRVHLRSYSRPITEATGWGLISRPGKLTVRRFLPTARGSYSRRAVIRASHLPPVLCMLAATATLPVDAFAICTFQIRVNITREWALCQGFLCSNPGFLLLESAELAKMGY